MKADALCRFSFTVNGFSVQAAYEPSFLKTVVEPLLTQWTKRRRQENRRIVIFLAAPPAAGKSTLALLFEHLSQQGKEWERVQALGMDGFHHYQHYILNHQVVVEGKCVSMKQVKGCPESFDYARLERYVRRLKQELSLYWPHYNRRKHDVEDDQLLVDAPIVLLEGNYLLLDEEPWRRLHTYCDASIFIEAAQEEVKGRLVRRKVAGGMLPHEALAFCENSDLRNVRRILAHRLPADLTLRLAQGNYREEK